MNSPARQFALDVVRRLVEAGHQALWAGGCVRDHLMGRTPKDYDVATDARPERIREVFGHRRTLPIGAAFGVISVMGPRAAGHIEVATFRNDSHYSDGRHPDSVTFCDARLDALRRDFTINGLFYDPLADEVLDYVEGRLDLERRRIRAIGAPEQRLDEDKLRMLRAVRFAAAFQFEIDLDTRDAIRRHAAEIHVVSPERIGAELRRILTKHAALGLQLLDETRLLDEVFPGGWRPDADAWQRGLATLDALEPALESVMEDEAPAEGRFATMLAALLRAGEEPERTLDEVFGAWRLSHRELAETQRLLRGLPLVLDEHPWPVVQRTLAPAGRERLLALGEAVAAAEGRPTAPLAESRRRLVAPQEHWNPPPLINGNDLKSLGLVPGPDFQRVLNSVRDEQLEGRLATRDEALAWARRLAGL